MNIKWFLIVLVLLTGCSYFKKDENSQNNNQQEVAKKKRINPNAEERAKAAAEGGLTLFGKKVGEGGGVVSFANSNVLWRASLETLDFIPLETVDYGGGLISSDWYKKNAKSKEEIKIRVQFLSNELSPNSIKVLAHKKVCSEINNNCKIVSTNPDLTRKIKAKIISKAREIKIADEAKSNK